QASTPRISSRKKGSRFANIQQAVFHRSATLGVVTSKTTPVGSLHGRQMEGRTHMTAKLHKADRGLALGFLLWASLSLVTLIDAQNQAQPRSANPAGPDASKGVWVVRFEPVDGFSPRTPAEFLGRIHVYSGQNGQIGYLRTKKQGSKLVGSFLADDADQLKAALNSVPGIQVTSVEKLTAETLAAYEA